MFTLTAGYRLDGNVSGTGFVLAATGKFGRKPATVTFVSGIQIKATVPNGAITSKVSVTTAAGMATSATNFTATLSITSFSRGSGPTGTVVTQMWLGSTAAQR